ncbi:MAG: hypothetical protein JJ992_04150, partial [Planctomycetes bacterium]|nr:hypothetical protein [Planctomycetota bacterium]
SGSDSVTFDDNTIPTLVDLGTGADSVVIGNVPTIPDPNNRTLEFPNGVPVADTDNMTSGVSAATVIYGGDGNDNFEVNHNAAKLYLHGGDQDDTFIINTFIVLRENPDDPHDVTNLTTIFGSSGDNRYSYLQNAPVFINGGEGVDTTVINGSPINDTFVVTEDFVAGGGRITYFTGIERLEINGGAGNDEIYVLSTSTDFETIVTGGSGDDVIHLGGRHPTLVLDPPAFTYQPPAFEVQDPPSVDYEYSIIDPAPQTIFIPESALLDRYGFNMSIFSFFGFFLGFNHVPTTIIEDELRAYLFANLLGFENQRYHDILLGSPRTNPPVDNQTRARLDEEENRVQGINSVLDLINRTTFTYQSVHAWWLDDKAGVHITFDIPAYESRVGRDVLPAPRTVTPQPIMVDPPGFAFQADAVYDVSQIRGRLTIEDNDAFEINGDQLIVHHQQSAATTASLRRRVDNDGNEIFGLAGLTGTGLTVDPLLEYFGVEFANQEHLEIRFGDGADHFTIDAAPADTDLKLVMGGGNDNVRVKQLFEFRVNS